MTKFPCPSCGAELTFQSSTAVFQVCPYCRSTVVRTNVDVQAIGKMAELQDDFSPLQLGTTGRAHGEFVLVGRVRVAWEDGFWNEWFIRFDDGREGWLGEAQGFYMISLQVAKPQNLPNAQNISLKQKLNIEKTEFEVDDIKHVTYSFAEGELPFTAAQGQKAISIDLRAGASKFASLSFDDDGRVGVYTGNYFEFSELHFQNLRQLDGW